VSGDDTGDSMTALEDSDAPVRKLKDLLLAYLLAANCPRWPGADGLAVDEVLSTYPQASEQGLVPGAAELCIRHPEFAELLRQFFAPHPVTGESES
jgi:hypothetical protein